MIIYRLNDSSWGTAVQEFIARENIRRFEAQLSACTDPQQRETLQRLLDAERQYLKNACPEKIGRPALPKGNP